MQKRIVSFLFLAITYMGTSQIKITQLHLNQGNHITFNNPNVALDGFNELAPNSMIMGKDFSAFSQNELYPYFPNVNGNNLVTNTASFNAIQVGLKLPKLPSGTFRIGLSTVKNNLLNTRGTYTQSFVVDTFISVQNGSMIFADSIVYQYYSGNYSNQQLRLDGAYIWENEAGKRWAFTAGLGLSLGLSYQSRTTLSYGERINSYVVNNENKGTSSFSGEYETFSNKMAWGTTAYVPLGIGFKLGTKRPFWIPWMVYTELRPFVSILSIPNHSPRFTPGIGTASGIRYTLN